MNCLFCQKEFQNKRKTAKFCSTKCRVYFNRGVSVTDKDTVTGSVTDTVTYLNPVLAERIAKLKNSPISYK